MGGTIRLAVALAALALGTTLLVTGPGQEAGLRAQLFSGGGAAVLCLEVDGGEEAGGRIGSEALKPGDVVGGVLELTHCDPMPAESLDLDVGFHMGLFDSLPLADPDLGELLVVVELRYGTDDLLTTSPVPGDRNVLLEIDAHPFRGNGDGAISMRELQAGINDLPTPGPPAAPTDFAITFKLLEGGGNDLQDDYTEVDLEFYLTDRTHGDLNG